MKHLSLYIILICGTLLMVGCRDKVEPPVDPTPQPRAEAERTVIVYMAADNSLFAAVRSDTTEMVNGKAQIPENVNFIIYLDDKLHKPAIYELSAKGGMQVWKQYEEETCSTDPEVMLEALREIEHYFPARHYGITFWSHSTGWAPRRNTFGQDETHTQPAEKSEMEIPALHDVLAQLPRFDYIFFDACFMQCIEVAYELRDVTDYMVGSPAEIPGPGAPYDKITEALCAGNPQGIVLEYDRIYPGSYNGSYYSGVLLSCIDCAKLEPLAEATGHYLTPFYMQRTEQSPYEYAFLPYCTVYWDTFTHCFDMRTTMCHLLSDEDYAAWMEYFDQAVPLYTLSSTNRWFANYCYHPEVEDPDCYGGVSMFVPLNLYNGYGWNEDFRNTSWYEAVGWEKTGW